jgi:hypothetical protein
MRGSPKDRNVSSIATKPSAVSGNPVSASQAAAPASVTHSAASKAICRHGGADQRAGLDPEHRRAGSEHHAAARENPLDAPADAEVAGRQQRVAGDERHLRPAVAQPG